jgi:solute:Na+ symporter, SSS family
LQLIALRGGGRAVLNEAVVQDNQYIVWVVVLAYMAIITGAGSYYARYVKTADTYFRGDNLIPWWAAGISMYMANFTAYTFVALASLVYMRGLPGLILETGPALAFVVAAVVFAPRWFRLNLTSPPEYLEARFNPLTRRLFSGLGILAKLLGNGIRLLSMCKFLEAVTGMPASYMIVVTGAVVILYTVLGGLWAVIVTDVLQFIVLFLAVIPMFLMSVIAIYANGGWEVFVSLMPEGYGSFPNTNPDAAYGGVPVDAGAQWQWLLVFWFTYLLDYNGDWGVIQRMCCTPSERDAKKAAWLAAALSLPHAFLLLGCCFVARVLWSEELASPNIVEQAELIYGLVAQKLLPAGLIGVVAAAMFSATMSTLNVSWAVMSASFANDLWRPMVHPNASDKELILVGRLAVLLVGAIATAAALIIAVTNTPIFGLAQGLVSLVVIPILIPLLLGLLLRRSHQYGALFGMGVSLMFGIGNKVAGQYFDAGIPFEWEIVISTVLCAVTMYASGWLPDSAEHRSKAARFFETMRHPRLMAETKAEIPPAMGVVGTFMMMIGGLVFLLVFMPQAISERTITLAAALVLLGLGYLLRSRHPLKTQNKKV